MYDLKFYSEYFFRAQPEAAKLDELKAAAIKDRQQLLNESANTAKSIDYDSISENYTQQAVATQKNK